MADQVAAEATAGGATETPAGAATTATGQEGGATAAPAGGQTETTTEGTGTAPEAAQAAATSNEGDTAKPAPKAPEAYADFKLPEGMVSDTAFMQRFKDTAKALDLTQEQAQQLVDMNTAQRQTAIEGYVAALTADKEFGGDKVPQTLNTAKSALDKFGSPDLMKMLVSTGLGNHPELIKTFARIGKAISEDTFVPGGRNPAAPKDAASTLYPTSQS